MSKFYGQVFGSAKTEATRRGNTDITVSAQSWNGSVQTRLWYSESGVLMVDISTALGSSANGRLLWSGSFEDLGKQLVK